MRIVHSNFVTAAAGPEGYPGGNLPEVALAGRSNVGKSSLLNKLVNRKGLARVSRRAGRTQTINFFLINKAFYLVDLPGYGFARVPEKVRMAWGPMVEGYLRERAALQGILLLIDIRREPTEMDLQLYEWLLCYRIPAAVAATKSDKLSRGRRLSQAETIRKKFAELEKELFNANKKESFSADKIDVPGKQNPGKASGKNPGKAPGKNPGKAPGKNPGKAPGKNPGKAPGKKPGKGPVVVPFSAKTGEGRGELLKIIEQFLH